MVSYVLKGQEKGTGIGHAFLRERFPLAARQRGVVYLKGCKSKGKRHEKGSFSEVFEKISYFVKIGLDLLRRKW